MRSLLIALGGLVAAAGLFALAMSLDGLAGAALVIVAIGTATVTVGLSISGSRSLRHLHAPRLKRTRHGRTTHRGRSHRCSECGAKRELRGHVWVCPPCDLNTGALPKTH